MSDRNNADVNSGRSVQSAASFQCGSKISQKECEIDEIMDFLKFSVKPSTSFGGTILFKFKEADDAEPKTIYAVEISEMRKVATRKNVRASEECPTCEVTISMDDFLWIYSGKASSADLARLVYAGRVVISGYAFRTVSKFAQSFDFSSEAWRNFYASRKTQDEMNDRRRAPSALEAARSVSLPSRDEWYFHANSMLDRLNITKVKRLVWEISLASIFGQHVVLQSVRNGTLRDKMIASGKFSVIASVIGNSGSVSVVLKRRPITPCQLYSKRILGDNLGRNPCPSKPSATIVDSIAVDNPQKTATIMFDFVNYNYIEAVKLRAKERQRYQHHRNRVDLGDAGMAQLDKLVKVIGKGGHSNLKRDNCSKYVPAPELLLREFRVNVTVLVDKLTEKASGRKSLRKIPAPEMGWLVRNGRSGSMLIVDGSSHDKIGTTKAALSPASSPLSDLPQSIIVEVNRAKIARNHKRFDGPKQRMKAKFALISRELMDERNPQFDEHLVFSDYL